MSLPSGWMWFRLDEVAHARLGKMLDKAKNSGPEREYLRNVNVRWFGFDLKDVQLMRVSDADAADLDIRNGDVLICEGGEPGRSAVWDLGDRQMTFQKALHRVRAGAALLPHWLVWHLKLASVTGQLSQSFTGSTIKHFPLVALNAYKVPVPPASEQRRIADKLDTVLARVDAVNDRLARVAPLLKRFRQSVLAAATSGKLTEEWRVCRPFSAQAKLLGEVGAVTGGLTKNSKRETLSLKRPYLRVANVYANELRLDDVAEIGLTEAEYQKTVLVSGDLLIVEGNGSIDQIGRAAIWRGEVDGCCHQNHLIRWRAGHGALSPFVHLWLMSPEGRAQLVLAASSTTGLHTLSVSKVAGLQLAIPDLDEQAEIVRRVEILFGYADRLEAHLQAAQTAADRLTPALLAKAFRGELVPQDPNDEPASELLKRLAAARASEAAPTRGRRRKATEGAS